MRDSSVGAFTAAPLLLRIEPQSIHQRLFAGAPLASVAT